MVNQEKLEELLRLFVEGKISKDEYDQIMDHIRESVGDENLNNAVDYAFRDIKNFRLLSDVEKELIYQNITQDPRFIQNSIHSVGKQKLRVLTIWYQIGIVASLLLLISTSLYFYTKKARIQKYAAESAKPTSNDINSGGNKAILTLADGSKIILDDAKNGFLANQAGVHIQKISNGELIYTFSNPQSPSSDEEGQMKEVYNTIKTLVGGKYQLNLPDGSKVWLNAASSLRFPTFFTGNTREVELTGEAYFEVAKNKNMPFRVLSNHQIVEVLGTQFNINSYSDEAIIKTTLIEGSVKVIYGDKVVLLSPGQQAQPEKNEVRIVDADTAEVVAWKNDYFLFNNEDIRSIMRKVSRWYNVEVTYSGNISEVGFGGNISRSKSISEVLDVLQFTNAVHFKIEGRRIIVMP